MKRPAWTGLAHLPRQRWTPAVFVLLFLVLGGTAHAQFAVCNQTIDAVNVSVAKETSGTFGTEGWWTIGANRCVDVIKEELTGRYVYVYATDVFGQPILSGSYEGHDMCIDAKRFAIAGTSSCWQRGFQSVRFMLVDTKEMPRWTFFLKEPDGN
jgi:uncharacterized membrane protein